MATLPYDSIKITSWTRISCIELSGVGCVTLPRMTRVACVTFLSARRVGCVTFLQSSDGVAPRKFAKLLGNPPSQELWITPPKYIRYKVLRSKEDFAVVVFDLLRVGRTISH